MTPEALESFLSVVSSFKKLAQSSTDKDLIFSIYEGSAACSVEAAPEAIDMIYSDISNAIKGKSNNKVLVKSLREIQEQLARDDYSYDFYYRKAGQDINLGKNLLSAKISKKRVRNEYNYRIRGINGLLNQIGGKTPNYHIDYGNGEKRTIECDFNEAIDINQYLYQTISVFVLSKEKSGIDNGEYKHLIILNSELYRKLNSFFREYYDEDDLVKRLGKIHDLIDDAFAKSKNGEDILETLLVCFNNKNFHLSEIKTLLVISKFNLANNEIKRARNNLLETYQNLKREKINV